MVESLDQRDRYLVTLAQVKKSIAKAERRLAHCRAKEILILQQLQSINEDLAERRVQQADVNIERAKHYHKRLCEKPRQVDTPSIMTILSRPSVTIAANLAVV